MLQITNFTEHSKVTLTTALLIYYLATSGTITDSLFAKQYSTLMSENRAAQHALAFLRMFTSLVLVANITDIKSLMFYTILCYMWFICTTKLDLEWNLLIFSLLFIGFIYENILQERENKAVDDKVLSEVDISKIKKKHKLQKIYIMVSIGILTLLGTFVYGRKKIDQYGGDFDFKKFFASAPNIDV